MTDAKYTAARLEALDKKVGRVHTIEDCRRVATKLEDAPESITDDDLVILGGIYGESYAVKARDVRTKALTTATPAAPPPNAAPPPRYVTNKQLKNFSEELGDVLVQVLKQQKEKIETLTKELEALRSRTSELESRPQLKHCGVWRNDATYVEGHLVTHNGGLWLATRATTDPPGTPDSHWRLIVKSGLAR